jgi:chloramphenicol 3-O-phosphotransferase
VVSRRPSRVIAIDGRSGAGKSTLAENVAVALGAQLVRVEDFYPGWAGLADGAAYLATDVLARVRAGDVVVPRRWDWHADEFLDGVPVHPGLIVAEGCGALSRASRPLVDVGVWLEVDADLRHRRATLRDADDSWWADWRAQEDAFYATEGSPELADVTLPADVGVAETLALLEPLL